jgi:prepilin-type N-terminal cleavage/methylation domain-containing protein
MTRADRYIHRATSGTTPAARPRAAFSPGFSLFELLFVISIIAIVAAIAVPKYGRSVARYRAECAARRVAADLALAKSTAKAVSADRSITFNTVAGSYTLASVRHLDHRTEPYTVTLIDAPYHADIYYADFGGAPQAVFDMYGAPKWSGKVVVRVGEFEQTVSLSRDDGEITIE